MTSSTNLIITPEAREDIYDVQQYTLETWGDEQVEVYEGVLNAAFQRIRSFPEIGLERNDGVREYAIRHHVILYRYEDDTVSILRVMHPRRLRD